MSNRHCDQPAGGEASGWTKKKGKQNSIKNDKR